MVDQTHLIYNIHPSIMEVEEFINDCGKSINTFTYFNSRPFSVINNHLTTILLIYKNNFVAYGHLEEERGIIWLGISVKSDLKGQGLGKLIMNYLIKFYIELNSELPLNLTVHINNLNAQKLFVKYGFRILKKINNVSYLMKYF